jgi:hypothetical protein
MILAHHLGEHLLPALLAGGAGAGSVLLTVGRVRLGRLVDWLRRG